MALRGGGRSVSQPAPYSSMAARRAAPPLPPAAGSPRGAPAAAPHERGVVYTGPAPLGGGAWSVQTRPGRGGVAWTDPAPRPRQRGAWPLPAPARRQRRGDGGVPRRPASGRQRGVPPRAVRAGRRALHPRPGAAGDRRYSASRVGAGGRRENRGPNLSSACVPAQGTPPPRSGACCSLTAPPATSRMAPAASASPTAAGERRRGGSSVRSPADGVGRAARRGPCQPRSNGGCALTGLRGPARGRPLPSNLPRASLSPLPQRPGAGPLRDQAPAQAGRRLRGPGEVRAGLRGLQDRAAGGLHRTGGTRRCQQVTPCRALGG